MAGLMVQDPFVGWQVDEFPRFQVSQQFGAADSFPVSLAGAVGTGGPFEILHRVVTEAGRVDVHGIEHLEPLPDSLHGHGDRHFGKRHGDAAVRVERAELYHLRSRMTGYINNGGTRILFFQRAQFLSFRFDDNHAHKGMFIYSMPKRLLYMKNNLSFGILSG